ncbi:hypothetical protein Aph02nite_15210 [Actinoplanes philippinensis]|uniref:Uncharacterized protein n=1 Tax=Actinoplanes philippinensis TaxID=35752 RepID=A0A1I1ZFQ4_9ACTN|nr:DUF6082 family protein [Actinoplanes philippinensis]GIE75571.1 hypothetical protein Aph02nite_15210 [Actinoplanes philippinensis]SFE29150.1 hypothetical protein SAMN05421541_10116 [Actinoplanes philippinensis]
MKDDMEAPESWITMSRVFWWMFAALVGTALTLATGVGMAVLLGRQGNAADWAMWSNVGQTFGVLSSIISGLALVVLVGTARTQFQEMREQRRELERQRRLHVQQGSELQRTAEAHVGLLHFRILKMAIDDPSLAEVWPEFGPDVTPERNRQLLYANLIYQLQRIGLMVKDDSQQEMLETMRYLFTSPIMREYWRLTEYARSGLPQDSDEIRLARKVDRLWRDYEAVASSERRNGRVPPESGPLRPVSVVDDRKEAEAA